MHLALHAAHHGPAFGRPVEDLERGLAALPEETWRDAAALAERLDAVPAFVSGLQLALGGQELGLKLGLGEIAAAPTDVALRAAGAPPVAEGIAWLVGIPGARAKLLFLAQALVPPPSAMRAWKRRPSKCGWPRGRLLMAPFLAHASRDPGIRRVQARPARVRRLQRRRQPRYRLGRFAQPARRSGRPGMARAANGGMVGCSPLPQTCRAVTSPRAGGVDWRCRQP
jgi:hypothetical protein